jgi:hypothetical protein
MKWVTIVPIPGIMPEIQSIYVSYYSTLGDFEAGQTKITYEDTEDDIILYPYIGPDLFNWHVAVVAVYEIILLNCTDSSWIVV